MPVVGHEVVRDSQAGEITIFSLEMERGPAAFELAGTIGSGNSQHLQSNVFAEAGLLRCGPLVRPAEVGIHEEFGSEGIGAHDCEPVGVPVPVPGVAAAADRRSHQGLAEHCRNGVGVMENTEGAGQIEFGSCVPVDLRVDLVTVESERAGHKIVVS